MTTLAVGSIFALAGMCVAATVAHLSVGMRQPRDRKHLVFAAVCFAMVPFATFQAWLLQARTPEAFIEGLRGNMCSAMIFFALFHWFIADYTGVRPRLFLYLLSASFAALFVVNLVLPFTFIYGEFTGIHHVRLPWGEEVAMGTGEVDMHNWWLILLMLATVAEVAFAVYATWRHNRTNPDRKGRLLFLGLTLFLLSVVQGSLMRLSLMDFPDLSALGFLSIIVIISWDLSLESSNKLIASENHFRSLVEQSPISMQFIAPNGTTTSVNPAWEKLWARKLEDLADLNMFEDQRMHDLGYATLLKNVLAGAGPEHATVVHRHSNTGSPAADPLRDKWIRNYVYPIRDTRGRVSRLVALNEDISEEKRAENAIRLIAAGVSSTTGTGFFQKLVLSLAQLFHAKYAYISIRDANNPGYMNTLAIAADGEIRENLSYEAQNAPCAETMARGTKLHASGLKSIYPESRKLVQSDAEAYLGIRLLDADGEPLGVLAVVDDKPNEMTGLAREILEIFAGRAAAELRRMLAETHIRSLAYYDYLTGLASRAHLHESLSDALREVRASDSSGALLLIDLDHFKTINDALSHDVGDEVLRAVARRLADVVGKRAFLARLGGDEFAVIIRDKALDAKGATEAAQQMANRIMDKLLSPLFVDERAFTLGASIGVVLFPQGGETELDIMRHADMALYRAKNMGRANIQFYSPEMQENAAQRLLIEDGLRRAVGNNELDLYFQPQLDSNGRVIGAEALLRWQHPEMGNIMPGKFIPIAEETGLIHSIGRWVFDQACARFTEWKVRGAPFSGYLSINVCPWQFNRADFVDQVRHALQKHAIDPGSIMLELTETALLYDLEETIGRLTVLRSLGIRIALDDFGTGYSSLAYLRDLPLDQLKIDKSFIWELTTSVEHPLVESMIAIGEHMKIPVVAEGVETAEQRDILLKYGCERFQGYLYSRPVPENDFLEWLTDHEALRAHISIVGPASLPPAHISSG